MWPLGLFGSFRPEWRPRWPELGRAGQHVAGDARLGAGVSPLLGSVRGSNISLSVCKRQPFLALQGESALGMFSVPHGSHGFKKCAAEGLGSVNGNP